MLLKQITCPYCKQDIESFSPRMVLADVFDVIHHIHVKCYELLSDSSKDSSDVQNEVISDRIVHNLKLIGIKVNWGSVQ